MQRCIFPYDNSLLHLSMVLTLFARLVGCASNSTMQMSSEDDISAIEEAVHTMNKHINKNDWVAWSERVSSDAVLMVPNRPAIRGRSAIMAVVTNYPPVVGGGVEILEVEARDDLAYVFGRYRLQMMMSGNRVMSDSGKTLEIWRKQVDGRWLLMYDMSSSDVPRNK
jgi:ketosteroid isomerase-like protein